MKKAYFILSLAAAAMVFTQSCRKGDLMERNPPVVTNQTVNASITENTSYTYTLPTAGPAQITASAAHAKASAISTDANGNIVFQYTPVANYIGTDVVVVSTIDGAAQQNSGCSGPGPGKGGHGGNCGHHGNGNHTTVTTIALTVTASATAAKNTGFSRVVSN